MSDLLDPFTDPTRLLALACASVFFGGCLKLSDLLQEHGYSWFRGSAMSMGCLSGGTAVAMLALGSTDLHHLWLVVVFTWIIRGRIDGLNHGVMAVAIILFHGFNTPQIITKPEVTLYFTVTLLPLGLFHDALQYTQINAHAWLRWFFRNQHLYWYLVGLGYLAFFSQNLEVPISIYTFVKGYGFLYDGRRDPWLRSLGIQCPGTEEGGTGELVGEDPPE